MIAERGDRLLKRLKAARLDNSHEAELRRLIRVDLLIVDDFALKPLRPPQDEDFHDLIAERYESAATILTSNLDFSEWGDAFAGNRILGAATLDRLRHGAYRIVLDDGFVSQVHARLYLRDGNAYVEDLGSRNGTLVNGQPLQGALRLRRGDRVQFGQTTLEAVR